MKYKQSFQTKKTILIILILTIGAVGCKNKLPLNVIDEYNVSMVLIPEGLFKMGADDIHGFEGPAHSVFLDDYYIDQYEVTNAQYKACVDSGECSAPEETHTVAVERYYGNLDYSDYPVMSISWENANSYCEWRGARLPTEAEWEKAARGTDGRTYPWGEDLDCRYANYGLITEFCVGSPTKVGSYPLGVSPFGVHDMLGNMTEYTADWFVENYYEYLEENDVNPFISDKPDNSFQGHTIRGGSWVGFEQNELRITSRNNAGIGASSIILGFRCAKTP